MPGLPEMSDTARSIVACVFAVASLAVVLFGSKVVDKFLRWLDKNSDR